MNSRLDRIESSLEKLTVVVEAHTRQIEAHSQQIETQTGRMGILLEHGQAINEFLLKTAAAQLRLAEAQNKLEAAQLETTEKLDALIRIVDEWIRSNRPQSGV